jgi:hypothetical protein
MLKMIGKSEGAEAERRRNEELKEKHKSNVGNPRKDKVDKASEDSFPASDPPSFTGAALKPGPSRG